MRAKLSFCYRYKTSSEKIDPLFWDIHTNLGKWKRKLFMMASKTIVGDMKIFAVAMTLPMLSSHLQVTTLNRANKPRPPPPPTTTPITATTHPIAKTLPPQPQPPGPEPPTCGPSSTVVKIILKTLRPRSFFLKHP